MPAHKPRASLVLKCLLAKLIAGVIALRPKPAIFSGCPGILNGPKMSFTIAGKSLIKGSSKSKYDCSSAPNGLAVSASDLLKIAASPVSKGCAAAIVGVYIIQSLGLKREGFEKR